MASSLYHMNQTHSTGHLGQSCTVNLSENLVQQPELCTQVQSLTLDTKVWEGPALDMMAELGNTMANAVYEEKLTKSYLTKSPLQGSAAGVSFTGEEDLASHLAK